jgi:hypothetical protein
MVKCIHCGSEDLSFTSDKQGFSGGKALAGAVVFGPLGLLAGTIGSKKGTTFCLCNSCHQTFSLKDSEKVEAKKKREENFRSMSTGQKLVRIVLSSVFVSIFFAIPLSWTPLTYLQSYLICAISLSIVLYVRATKTNG